MIDWKWASNRQNNINHLPELGNYEIWILDIFGGIRRSALASCQLCAHVANTVWTCHRAFHTDQLNSYKMSFFLEIKKSRWLIFVFMFQLWNSKKIFMVENMWHFAQCYAISYLSNTTVLRTLTKWFSK